MVRGAMVRIQIQFPKTRTKKQPLTGCKPITAFRIGSAGASLADAETEGHRLGAFSLQSFELAGPKFSRRGPKSVLSCPLGSLWASSRASGHSSCLQPHMKPDPKRHHEHQHQRSQRIPSPAARLCISESTKACRSCLPKVICQVYRVCTRPGLICLRLSCVMPHLGGSWALKMVNNTQHQDH